MNVLSNANLKAHMGRPLTPEGKFLTLWQPAPDFIHCCIESRGCRYSHNYGACIMCDYGIGRNLSPNELKSALYSQLLPHMNETNILLLGSYGSVLDESEISNECLTVLLDFLKKCKVSTLIFETHCESVTREKLGKIKEFTPKGTQVVIEMGYESCDQFVLHNCLNKFLDLKVLENAITLTHEMRMLVTLNVFLGAPFLNPADQFETTQRSIQWAVDHDADSLVLFPANIKPFTLLHKLYLKGIYAPISQWMLPILLQSLSEDVLERISLSWYGDRKNFYENGEYPLIPPTDCDNCHEVLFDFYRNFITENKGIKRKELINRLLKYPLKCNCRNKTYDNLSKSQSRYSENEIFDIISNL